MQLALKKPLTQAQTKESNHTHPLPRLCSQSSFPSHFPHQSTWVIWEQREAHETPREKQDSMCDIYVLAAAQWILSYGQSFFKQALFPRDVNSDNLRLWKPGPRYDGNARVSFQRCHFWRDRFIAEAPGERRRKKGRGEECMVVAAKAAESMDSSERSRTFRRF